MILGEKPRESNFVPLDSLGAKQTTKEPEPVVGD
jgi:hypothetical protein